MHRVVCCLTLALTLACGDSAVDTGGGPGPANAQLAGLWDLSSTSRNHTALDLDCTQSANILVKSDDPLTGSANGTFSCGAPGGEPTSGAWSGVLSGTVVHDSVSLVVRDTPMGDCTYSGIASPGLPARATAIAGSMKCVTDPNDNSSDLEGTWSAAR